MCSCAVCSCAREQSEWGAPARPGGRACALACVAGLVVVYVLCGGLHRRQQVRLAAAVVPPPRVRARTGMRLYLPLAPGRPRLGPTAKHPGAAPPRPLDGHIAVWEQVPRGLGSTHASTWIGEAPGAPRLLLAGRSGSGALPAPPTTQGPARRKGRI